MPRLTGSALALVLYACAGACPADAATPTIAELAARERGDRTVFVAYDASRTEPIVVVDTTADLSGVADLRDDGAWVFRDPVDYVRCEGDSCTVLRSLEAQEVLLGTRLSPEGRRELIAHGTPVVVEVFDLTTARRLGELGSDGWLDAPSRMGLPVGWVGEDRVMVSWSAGSFVAEASLYDTTGRSLLDLSCDAITRDPSGFYAACWSPQDAPSATSSPIQVFDLHAPDGQLEVELPPELRGDVDVHEVFFTTSGYLVVLLGTDTPGHVRRVAVRLHV